MTKFTIRSVTEQDIPFLWEMLYESIYIPAGQPRPERDILDHPLISKYVDGWGREGDLGFIAVNELGEPIGSITMRYFNQSNKGFGYVNDNTPELGMAILSEYRGQGIGTELMTTLIQHAKITGISAISLSVDPNNPAIHLYTCFGFKEVGVEGTSITMILELNRMVDCEYCSINNDEQGLVLENKDCMFLLDKNPEIEGAGIIIPKMHRETVFDLTQDEWNSTFQLLKQVKEHIDEAYRPDGYNVGWNAGTVGGQHVFHAHMHVIPRFADEPYAGKGIRYWFKSKENRRP